MLISNFNIGSSGIGSDIGTNGPPSSVESSAWRGSGDGRRMRTTEGDGEEEEEEDDNADSSNILMTSIRTLTTFDNLVFSNPHLSFPLPPL